MKKNETYTQYADRLEKESLGSAKKALETGNPTLFQKQLLIMDKYGLEMGDTVLVKMIHMGHTPEWSNYLVTHQSFIENTMAEMESEEIELLVAPREDEDVSN